MSHRIYTPEFKDEAVRQVVERGYTVKEVAEHYHRPHAYQAQIAEFLSRQDVAKS